MGIHQRNIPNSGNPNVGRSLLVCVVLLCVLRATAEKGMLSQRVYREYGNLPYGVYRDNGKGKHYLVFRVGENELPQ